MRASIVEMPATSLTQARPDMADILFKNVGSKNIDSWTVGKLLSSVDNDSFFAVLLRFRSISDKYVDSIYKILVSTLHDLIVMESGKLSPEEFNYSAVVQDLGRCFMYQMSDRTLTDRYEAVLAEAKRLDPPLPPSSLESGLLELVLDYRTIGPVFSDAHADVLNTLLKDIAKRTSYPFLSRACDEVRRQVLACDVPTAVNLPVKEKPQEFPPMILNDSSGKPIFRDTHTFGWDLTGQIVLEAARRQFKKYGFVPLRRLMREEFDVDSRMIGPARYRQILDLLHINMIPVSLPQQKTMRPVREEPFRLKSGKDGIVRICKTSVSEDFLRQRAQQLQARYGGVSVKFILSDVFQAKRNSYGTEAYGKLRWLFRKFGVVEMRYTTFMRKMRKLPAENRRTATTPQKSAADQEFWGKSKFDQSIPYDWIVPKNPVPALKQAQIQPSGSSVPAVRSDAVSTKMQAVIDLIVEEIGEDHDKAKKVLRYVLSL